MDLWIGVLAFIAVLVVAGMLGYFISRRSRSVLDLPSALEEDARPIDGASSQTATATATAPPAPARRSLGDRLAKTRDALGGRLRGIFGSGAMDAAFWDGLEEALIGVDVGVPSAVAIVEAVRDAKPESPDDAREALRDQMMGRLDGMDRTLSFSGTPAKVVVVGVNGAGKTTTIAKMAARLQERDFNPLLGAADTFRAAADEQLRMWAGRVGVEVVGGEPGADPASVAFDALQAGRTAGNDVVIVDTAGRLQNKRNLMDELAKIVRVLERDSDPVDEVLLVIDATTGQNGLQQAKVFAEVTNLTGIVLTKLDGTAKGGVVVAIEQELGVPVKFIGVGEGIDDLIEFVPADFVDALLGAS